MLVWVLRFEFDWMSLGFPLDLKLALGENYFSPGSLSFSSCLRLPYDDRNGEYDSSLSPGL